MFYQQLIMKILECDEAYAKIITRDLCRRVALEEQVMHTEVVF